MFWELHWGYTYTGDIHTLGTYIHWGHTYTGDIHILGTYILGTYMGTYHPMHGTYWGHTYTGDIHAVLSPRSYTGDDAGSPPFPTPNLYQTSSNACM